MVCLFIFKKLVMCEIVTQQQGGKQRKRLYQVQSTVLCSVCGLGNKVTFYHDEPDQDTVLY
jgi:hypothetical protein